MPRADAGSHNRQVMSRACTFVCLLLLATSARAQEGPPIPPAPPQPRLRYVGPPPWEIDALEARGRHKKRVGMILMVSGGLIMGAGTALLIAGAADTDNHCFGRYHYADYYDTSGYYYRGYTGGCSDRALSIAGATTTVLGLGALVPGVLEQVSGARDVDAARSYRAGLSIAHVTW